MRPIKISPVSRLVCLTGGSKERAGGAQPRDQGWHVLSYGRPANYHLGVDDLRGLQLGLVNRASTLYGVQCGLIWNEAKDAQGLQFGMLNTADTMTGLQVGLLNAPPNTMTGVQVGFVNRAASMTGVQLGLVNTAETLTGIQIGLLNVLKESQLLLLPIIRVNF